MVHLGFWKKLKKPFFILAPMADVTDFAFREMFAKYGAPDVFFTEFVSADGLCSEKGREKLLIDLKFSKKQKPIVAQIFTSRPENARRVASLCVELGFHGIDINMGCPDKKVERQGAGAGLMKNYSLAKEIILATKDGAGSASANRRTAIPVSVKTRLGYNKDELEKWLPNLLECAPSAITLHARTRKEMSKVPARWERIMDAVNMRDKYSPSTLIIGNGDVWSLEDAREKAKKYGVDGVMIGRGAFGSPWFFAGKVPPLKKRLEIMAEHTLLFEKTFSGTKSFNVMKKHFKAYVSGFRGASELRTRLMETSSAKEVSDIVKNLKLNPSLLKTPNDIL